jgi:lipopolysaccharide/colanic/teichoic acid biosynthesis glycosyltransferase
VCDVDCWVEAGYVLPLNAGGKSRSRSPITPVGRFQRISRLDDIPHLWIALCDNMSSVGARLERPEFVSVLNREIPYHQPYHTVRPGIIGWVRIRCKHGNSVEGAREKLWSDMFYMKNMSVGLDLLTFFQRIKVIPWSRETE